MRKTALIVLDGFGFRSEANGNAILNAKTPFVDTIATRLKYLTLMASGEAVGLPYGEAGNSEVGHINIGSGRVVISDFARITETIKDGSFYRNKTLLQASEHVKSNSSNFHIVGILSKAGIHGHLDHIKALIKYAQKNNISPIIHIITDGRDSPPKSAIDFIKEIENCLDGHGIISTISGRYYAMDRDKRWDRTAASYEAMVNARGETFSSAVNAIEDAYKNNQTDEFITPRLLDNYQLIKSNDAVIFSNFRSDRAIQLTEYFVDPSFNVYQRNFLKNIFFATMTEYRHKLAIHPLYSIIHLNNPQTNPLSNPLSEIISNYNLKQIHISESEKKAHISYFFNAGRQKLFKNEKNIIVPSPKVASYDQTPEMSLKLIVEAFKQEYTQNKADFILLNFANADMVGHTGNYQSTIKAIEAVDKYLYDISLYLLKNDITVFITADHGNAEYLINNASDSIDKEHSVNPVPFFMITPDKIEEIKTIATQPLQEKAAYMSKEPIGILADIAPTILEYMELSKSSEMTGESLLNLFYE